MKNLKKQELSAEEKATLEQRTTQAMVNNFMTNFMKFNVNQLSNAFIICGRLAKFLGQQEMAKKIDSHFFKTKFGCSVGTLEKIVFRGLSSNERFGKIYNYGYKQKSFTLKDAMDEQEVLRFFIYDCFASLCAKYDIIPEAPSPNINFSTTENPFDIKEGQQ